MNIIDFTDKVNKLRELVEIQQMIAAVNGRYVFEFYAIDDADCTVTEIWKHKYVYLNIGGSGRYMIENSTGIIFGIQAYGKVNRRKQFGTLDTITDYNWGGYWTRERKAV